MWAAVEHLKLWQVEAMNLVDSANLTVLVHPYIRNKIQVWASAVSPLARDTHKHLERKGLDQFTSIYVLAAVFDRLSRRVLHLSVCHFLSILA